MNIRMVEPRESRHSCALIQNNPQALATEPRERPETRQCPNCGEELRGEYCQGCGQKKVHRHELGLKHFFINAANEFTDLESNKAVRTFTVLLFKPGHLTGEYLAGRESRYISPGQTKTKRFCQLKVKGSQFYKANVEF